MSIMAFELPIMETAFALSQFEFQVFTLAIDFQFRIVTFWKPIFEFELSVSFNGHPRPP